MNKYLLVSILLLSFAESFSQNAFGGLSDNYLGVRGVFTNPANIADSRYRWHVNLIGAQVNITNDVLSVNSRNLKATFEDGEIGSLIFDKGYKEINMNQAVEVFGPSFMLNINKNMSVALSSRVRQLGHISGVDIDFWQSLADSIANEKLPLTFNSNKLQKAGTNTIGEIGVSVGRTLLNDGKHFLKAGLTVKYLSGFHNAFLFLDQIQGRLDKDILRWDGYFTNTSGKFGFGSTKPDLFQIEKLNEFKADGYGIGGDVGLVYEYRPDATLEGRHSQNKYKLKVGVALLDLGSLKYTPNKKDFANYSLSIPQGQRWYPSDLDDKKFPGEVIAYLDSSSYFTNDLSNTKPYKVSLPTSLRFSVDYAVKQNIYVEFAGLLNLIKTSNEYSSFYNDQISLTPRWEMKTLSIGMPLHYNKLSKIDVGFALRFAGMYLGSKSVLSFLFDKTKQLDLHFGISFGGKYRKVRKTENE